MACWAPACRCDKRGIKPILSSQSTCWKGAIARQACSILQLHRLTVLFLKLVQLTIFFGRPHCQAEHPQFDMLAASDLSQPLQDAHGCRNLYKISPPRGYSILATECPKKDPIKQQAEPFGAVSKHRLAIGPRASGAVGDLAVARQGDLKAVQDADTTVWTPLELNVPNNASSQCYGLQYVVPSLQLRLMWCKLLSRMSPWQHLPWQFFWEFCHSKLHSQRPEHVRRIKKKQPAWTPKAQSRCCTLCPAGRSGWTSLRLTRWTASFLWTSAKMHLSRACEALRVAPSRCCSEWLGHVLMVYCASLMNAQGSGIHRLCLVELCCICLWPSSKACWRRSLSLSGTCL